MRRVLLLVIATLGIGQAARAQNVVLDWNNIASTTIVTTGGKASVASGVWFAYTQIAVYDAVNAIDRRFKPFYYRGPAPEGASAEAAAVAAAHRVLVHYFPGQAETLDTHYGDSLASLSVDDLSKSQGIDVGEAAAATLIAARDADGLEADVPYEPLQGPGFWQPTPPGFLNALTPWLGQMRPFTMSTASQFLPEGPTPLDRRRWKRDYEETRRLGEVNSQERTPEQTEVGLFWTEHTGRQYGRAFRYLAANYDLDLPETARLLAVLWTGFADAGIGCWNGKYTYSFWRPVTAIRAGGGNPDLIADANWTSLGTTPNHPEYPAAHGCQTGVVSQLIAGFFRTTQVHVVVDSTVTGTTHVFDSTDDLFDEVVRARILAGFHYRHSVLDGGRLATHVARQLLRRHFRRVRREPSSDK
jgi:hypothetical protein